MLLEAVRLWLPLIVAQLAADALLPLRSSRESNGVGRWLGRAVLQLTIGLLFLGGFTGWPLALLAAVLYPPLSLLSERFERAQVTAFSMRWVLYALLLLAMSAAWIAFGQPLGRNVWLRMGELVYLRGLVLAGGFLLTIFVGSQWVDLVVEPFARQLPPRPDRTTQAGDDRSDAPVRGFPEGGRIIGLLERALIFVLVIAGELGAVGFLVAAKSVFRFGELRERENRVEAEYILIGTLASFLWGLVWAYATGLAWRFIA
jgi:hypothetical protein